MTMRLISKAGLWLLLAGIAAAVGTPVRAQSPGIAPAQTEVPTVTYRRVFKGSKPEFVEIVVRQDGIAKADVRQLDESSTPQEFEVGAPIRSKIFELSGQLKNFKGLDLDVHRKIA